MRVRCPRCRTSGHQRWRSASLGKLMGFCLEGNSLTKRITQNGEPGIQDRHHRQEAYRCPAKCNYYTENRVFGRDRAERRLRYV